MNESANSPEKVGHASREKFPAYSAGFWVAFRRGFEFLPLCQVVETGRTSRVPPKLDFSYLIGWAAGLGSVAPADTILARSMA
jgi:hypothetical protein